MTRVAIIGAGTMGRRLAVDFARVGHDVSLYDIVPATVEDALRWCAGVAEGWHRDGALGPMTVGEFRARLHPAHEPADALDGASAIVENVPERVDVKRRLFAAIADAIPPDALLISNTSSLPGSLLADATGCPERFINANFGHLGHRKVEVMPHPGTSAATRARAVAFLRAAGFVPVVLLAEQFGYSSNRTWRAVKKEVLRQLQAGITTAANVDRAWMLDWEVPIGPCGLMDRIGLDVVADIEQAYADHLGDPAEAPPPFLQQLIREGRLGVKTGEGFYRYPAPAYAQPGFLDGDMT